MRRRPTFDPAAHEGPLVAVLRELQPLAVVDERAFHRAVRRHPKGGPEVFSKSELIRGARWFAARYGFDARALAEKLRAKPVRTGSGVAPLTVLTKPFPCPGRCVFCPSDARMPKSYLAMEPGAQRATQNAFDPFAQTASRLSAFHQNGHPIDKIELIILGGTWSSHPQPYQRWFVKRCLDALNAVESTPAPAPDTSRLDDFFGLPASAPGRYNEVVSRHLRVLDAAEEDASWAALEEAQRANERASARCVGLSVETRPDRVDEDEVLRIRRLGATKVQLGVQSLSDRVLALNERGHDVAATRRAFALLRAAGFKIQAHWMPNLLGSDPGADVEDFARLFDDPAFRPDELKIYPCSLVESAELMDHHRAGRWRPYAEAELLEVLVRALARVPEWCRVTRVVRDIPSHDIVVGNQKSNFRELVARELARRGLAARDIRAREIARPLPASAEVAIEVTEYASAVGRERFIQAVTPERGLVGFLRLSLPSASSFVPELAGRAVIREVHVYGPLVELGDPARGRAQHAGFGTRLVERARTEARDAGFAQLAVISAIGTREYYRKLGFEDGALYLHADARAT